MSPQAMQQASNQWGDPGLTELLQLSEDSVVVPALSGGQKSVTLSRAGILKTMRFRMDSVIDVGVFAAAATLSPYGPLAAIDTLSVKANGSIDMIELSGFGATVYNEVQNRDGSILDHPVAIAALNVADAAALAVYDTLAAVGTKHATFPFEVRFSLPMSIRGLQQEIGLWILQNQAIDVNVKCQFNPLYTEAAVTPNAVWSGAALLNTVTLNALSQMYIERELYDVPVNEKYFPRLDWAHQIIEYTVPWTGSFSRFNIPRSGLLLRAIVINLTAAGLPVEYTDVPHLKWVYGANRTPIDRTGAFLTHEYLSDYNRLPPKGVQVLDFYKWGDDGLKLVKDTDILSNLRIETNFTATATGTQKIILDRLYPVQSNVG